MKREKKFIAVTAVLGLWAAGTSFAVWPPSPSAQGAAAQSYAGAGTDKPADRRSRTASERLENDTRRLEEILNDLKEDAKELHQSSGTGGSGNPIPGPKK